MAAGGALAPLNIRLLKKMRYPGIWVLAVDTREDAIGRYFADDFARVPLVDLAALLVLPLVPLLLAQRARCAAAIRSRPSALIVFFLRSAGLAAALPPAFAHRAFWAAAILARDFAETTRLPPACFAAGVLRAAVRLCLVWVRWRA